MKNWIAKLRISAALDSDKQLPPKLRKRIARSGGVREFASRTAALDDALKRARPRNDPPPWLHAWVMRSVRQEAIPAQRPRWPARLAWVGGAVAALALGSVCWTIFTSRGPQPSARTAGAASLDTASGALQLGSDLARTAPATLVAPLSNEMDQLNNDLNKTAEFLMASLP